MTKTQLQQQQLGRAKQLLQRTRDFCHMRDSSGNKLNKHLAKEVDDLLRELNIIQL